MMREAVEQRGGHLGLAEDSGPFTEAQVGGDDDAGALVDDQRLIDLTAGEVEAVQMQSIQIQYRVTANFRATATASPPAGARPCRLE